MGFAGEPFKLNAKSQDLLSGIRASSLSDFARQMNGSLAQLCTAA